MTTKRFDCNHCGESFMPQHYQMHFESLKKKGIKIPSLAEVRAKAEIRARAEAPGADAEAHTPNPPRRKSPKNPKVEEPVIVHQPTPAKPQMPMQSLRSNTPIQYIDCPHCDGVLVIGDEKVDHIDDLRSFLKSMAPAVQTSMVSPISRDETLVPAGSHGAEEDSDNY